MKKILLMLALIAALPAHAQVVLPQKEAAAPIGPYVGALVGRSEAKRGCIGIISGGGRACDRTDFTMGLFAGYQLHRNYGAEAAWTNLGKVIARTRGAGTASTQHVSATMWDAMGVGILPIDDKLSAFAKFGMYRATLDTSERGVAGETNFGVTYAGGLQWDFSRTLGARGTWQRYRTVGREIYGNNLYDVLGVSVLYRFQ